MDPTVDIPKTQQRSAQGYSETGVAKLQFSYSAPIDPLSVLLKQQQNRDHVISKPSVSEKRDGHLSGSDASAKGFDHLSTKYPLGEEELFSYVNPKGHPRERYLASSVSALTPTSPCATSSSFVARPEAFTAVVSGLRSGDLPSTSPGSAAELGLSRTKSPRSDLQHGLTFDHGGFSYEAREHGKVSSSDKAERSVRNPAVHSSTVARGASPPPLPLPSGINHPHGFLTDQRGDEKDVKPISYNVLHPSSGDARSDFLSLQSSHTASAFTAITQNVLEHARDFQAMARNAASSLLNSATANSQMRAAFYDADSSPNLDLSGSLTAAVTSLRRQQPFGDADDTAGGVSSGVVVGDAHGLRLAGERCPQDDLWALYAGSQNRPGSQAGISSSSVSVSSNMDEESANYLFDPKMPYFGRLQLGWTSTCPKLDTRWKVIKCNGCWEVFGVRRRPQATSIYEYRTLVPERLVPRFWPAVRAGSVNVPRNTVASIQDPGRSGAGDAMSTGIDYNNLQLLSRESVSLALNHVICLWGSVPPLHGKLLATNFRLIFFPSLDGNAFDATLGTQWMHMCNFWDIPLASIHKLVHATLSSKEKSQLLHVQQQYWTTLSLDSAEKEGVTLSHKRGTNPRYDGLCVEITTKDMRKLRFLIQELGRERRALATLLRLVFQNSIATLYAFNALRDATTEPSSNQHSTEEVAPRASGSPSSVNVTCEKRRDIPLSVPYSPHVSSFNYIPEREWERLLVPHHREWLRISSVNDSFSVCPTYPKQLVVPKAVTDDMLRKIASFRCKHRFPYLSWASCTTLGSLWRCSQPKSMFQRCTEDEILLGTITSSSASHRTGKAQRLPLLILDARPLINAVVNKASGAGFENTSTHYKGCRIEFASIDNIHYVRQAWKKMVAAVASITNTTTTLPVLTRHFTGCHALCSIDSSSLNPCEKCPYCNSTFRWNVSKSTDDTARLQRLVLVCDPTEPQWIYSPPALALSSGQSTNSAYSAACQQLGNSLWYDYVQRILRASNLAISQLRQGEAVLIHCSDGWDRTIQLTSLVMLCMDGYYRTLRGFLILIEQEFLQGGYQFHTRCGHPGRLLRSNQKSSTAACSSQQTNLSKTLQSVHVSEETSTAPPSVCPSGAVPGFDEGTGEATTQQDFGSEVDCGVNNSRQQQSPVFIQWLDCVYQIMVQFPTCFEFTTAILDVLAAELYACFYGTFLLDSSREREMAGLSSRTFSLWDSIMQVKHRFVATELTELEYQTSPLMPNTHEVAVWYSYWFRHRPVGLNYLAHSSFGL